MPEQTSAGQDRAHALAEDVRLFQMRIAGQDEVGPSGYIKFSSDGTVQRVLPPS